ncbi:glycosyltransferase family 4 protein [Microvirga sp. 17 mud 1-3]|uniref:MraY family glycosyltransferase n=1 Tax=Microvirga sp. 17 mud 1-3 TaxID=2082949 RepID=UPI000D6C252F|nr:glycosyltransferase family 4 protein [Microvirga sp. 17 mud 1-3]AWM88891.1 glycosyl transferase [Microvirga sp. 17 mud 1-3]
MLFVPALLSALLSVLLIVVLKPLLVRYALARPNARSSHRIPTPQGGGIAVVGASLLVTGLLIVLFSDLTGPATGSFLTAAAAGLVLAVVGATDDIRPLPTIPRLLLQIGAVTAVVLTSDVRLLPDLVPLGLERALLVFGGVWFVNLVNFMDGLDWITVAEMVPVTAFVAFCGWAGLMPLPAVYAAALCGALIGFAPFNRPVARLFLGDVGSLPIGLLVGWLLLQLAGTGALVAALLLPLYYLMDATITLLRRLARREKIWEAHRTHFYQKATDNGFSALAVSAHVFGLNLALVALATITLVWRSAIVQVAALAAGVVLVALVLRLFSRPRSKVA